MTYYETVENERKILTILGSTGSIGTQTLEVLAETEHQFAIGWLTTNKNIELLEKQTRGFQPKGVVISDETSYANFKKQTQFKGEILCGEEGICSAASDSENNVVMSSLVGFSGVLPTLEAIKSGATIALANKETLVSAGEIITTMSRKYGAEIIAVDSEHSAILQCLAGEKPENIEKLILTASGGPFREKSREELAEVTVAQALKHPNWVMGSKVTIDSATLMNKSLEVIEARWLFDVPAEKIEVVVHPQSIIHSLVQFIDGSVKAQLGLPTMKTPILYALSYPHRVASKFERMNLALLKNLTFFEPNLELFPCLRLGFEALKTAGNATAVLNAANEIAVSAFLQGRIRFYDIPRLVELALEKISHKISPTIQEIVETDKETREFVRSEIDFEY